MTAHRPSTPPYSPVASAPKRPLRLPPVTLRCDRDWCRSESLTPVSYGDGKTYHRCPVGHVTPKPPPPDLHALDDLADADD